MESPESLARIERLESQVRLLIAACGVFALSAGFLLWREWQRPVHAAEASSVLHLKGLVIEDGQGRARILMGAPFPGVRDRVRQDTTATSILFIDEKGHDRISIGEAMPAQINGKVPPNFHRIGEGYALNLYDSVGNERGGMGFLTNGTSLNRAAVVLDRPGYDAVGMSVDDRSGIASVGVQYAPDAGAYATGAILATTGSKAFLMIKDVQDVPRLMLGIEGAGPPSLKTFDKDGKSSGELVPPKN